MVGSILYTFDGGTFHVLTALSQLFDTFFVNVLDWRESLVVARLAGAIGPDFSGIGTKVVELRLVITLQGFVAFGQRIVVQVLVGHESLVRTLMVFRDRTLLCSRNLHHRVLHIPDPQQHLNGRRAPESRAKETNMAAQNDALKDRLSRYREIKITVTGRKSGRPISNPVWFALDDDKVYLLPVQGSDTQWYKNVLKNPKIRVDAGDAETELKAVPITDAKQVGSVVEKFRKKYGAKDVKRYYSKFDVAVVNEMQ